MAADPGGYLVIPSMCDIYLTFGCGVLCVDVLQISVSKSLTKGEASDLISEHKCSLAEPAQLQELQVGKLHLAVHARDLHRAHQHQTCACLLV